MQDLIMIGGGGHALSCLDVILSTGKFSILGYVDSINQGNPWNDVPYLGDDSSLPSLLEKCPNVFISVGQIKSVDIRRKIVQSLRSTRAQFPAIIAPTAYVSPLATIGKGTIVMQGAHVGPGAIVGDHSILNTKSLIEHGARIGNFVHVSTAAVVNGDVTVEDGSFIGSNSVLCQGITLPSGAFVQAGEFIGKKHVWK